ncbi:uncharacterized protein ARB_07384 [Trichophyton benhamiae CBS 112371]|uniref:Uncharacterized protein n=1 Tax=Arthroderma benhamiae (strain ATCC MYA-4681 / CBS 112371) TaxID=663331 RepID=D4AT20_ARTBC|nr:uncharacterized protein ARB_07384 [Trichophyton benhamiae CBS 112371]EFE33920.1 conserved hypothetical protein [Trichophyton benhamiae CBS 112371]
MANQEGFSTANSDTLLHEPNYRTYVLQLSEKKEEEELTALRQKALDIGLTIKDDSEESKGRLEIASESYDSSTPTPSTLMSPSQVTIPSSVSSSTQRLPSGAHSVSSMATCPTTCNEGKTHQKLPVVSPAPSRHSFDASYYQDHRFTSGFRQSILSRFPYFKKRLSVPNALPSGSSSPLIPSQIFRQDYTVEARIEVAPSSESPSPVHLEIPKLEEPIDMESVARSLSCSILTTLRDIHESQKRRHLEFQRKIINSIKTKHDALIEVRRKQNQENEAALESRNTAKAARIEERDLVAELSLVAELQREKQSLQTSIRHMEAYFNTPPPSLSSDKNDFYASLQPREYTDQKRNRLFQSYHELATLDALHQSKIKVLRDRQARAFQESLQDMELDSIELARKNSEALSDLEKRKQEETEVVLAWLDGKKQGLIYRWALEEGIARRQLEDETRLTYGPLPAISFSEGEYDGLTLEN